MLKRSLSTEFATTTMARVRLCLAFVLLASSLVLFDHAARNAAATAPQVERSTPAMKTLAKPIARTDFVYLTVA